MRNYFRQASVLVALTFLALLLLPAAVRGQPKAARGVPAPKPTTEKFHETRVEGEFFYVKDVTVWKDPQGNVIKREEVVSKHEIAYGPGPQFKPGAGPTISRETTTRDAAGKQTGGLRETYREPGNTGTRNADRFNPATGKYEPVARGGSPVREGERPPPVSGTTYSVKAAPAAAPVGKAAPVVKDVKGLKEVKGVKDVKGLKVEKAVKAPAVGEIKAPPGLKPAEPAKVVKPALPKDLKVPAKAAEAPKAPSPPAPPPAAPPVAKPTPPAPPPPAPPVTPPTPKAPPPKVTPAIPKVEPKLPPPPPPKEGPPPTIR
jgi:hypothetical protein